MFSQFLRSIASWYATVASPFLDARYQHLTHIAHWCIGLFLASLNWCGRQLNRIAQGTLADLCMLMAPVLRYCCHGLRYTFWESSLSPLKNGGLMICALINGISLIMNMIPDDTPVYRFVKRLWTPCDVKDFFNQKAQKIKSGNNGRAILNYQNCKDKLLVPLVSLCLSLFVLNPVLYIIWRLGSHAAANHGHYGVVSPELSSQITVPMLKYSWLALPICNIMSRTFDQGLNAYISTWFEADVDPGAGNNPGTRTNNNTSYFLYFLHLLPPYLNRGAAALPPPTPNVDPPTPPNVD